MKKGDLTYEKAMQELEEISKALEENTLAVDELTVKVERASTLLRFCKGNLRNIETKLDELFEDME